MIKYYQAILLFFLMPTLSILEAKYDSLVEFRAAAFYHADENFRQIYGRVSPNVQLEATARTCLCIDLWLNVDYFREFGRPKKRCGSTQIDVFTVSLGPKWICRLDNCVDFYLGIGPTFAKTWLRNRFRCRGSKESFKKFACGGVLKSGFYVYLCPDIIVDIFADYFYQPFHFNGKLVKLGGIKAGLGVGKFF